MKKIKITFLSKYDCAGCSYRVYEAVKKENVDDFDLDGINKKHGQGSPHFYIKTFPSLKDYGHDKAMERIQSSDIIHYVGDLPYQYNFYGIEVPRSTKIIYTTIGTKFRKRLNRSVYVSDFNAYGGKDLYTPGWHYMPMPHYKFNYKWKRADKFRIVHIPSNPVVKGTDIIKKAIGLLKRDDFEFVCKTNIAHEESILLKESASLYIDQLLLPGYGISALEALTFGIPVICWGDNDLVYTPTLNAPEPLADLINSMLDWDILERASIKSFEKFKSKHGLMGKRWINVYYDLMGLPEKRFNVLPL